MSDAAVATICGAVITVATSIVGFLVLWVKLKYGATKLEESVDSAKRVEENLGKNTEITQKVSDKLNGGIDSAIDSAMHNLSERFKQLDDHNMRISSLETKLEAVKGSVDNLSKNVDSTRHEMRNHLQTITNTLATISVDGHTK